MGQGRVIIHRDLSVVSAAVCPANGARLRRPLQGKGEIISLIAGIDGATGNGPVELPGFELPHHVPVTRALR